MLCPACRATIPETTATCDFCSARLARDPSGHAYVVFPEIRPGEPIVSLDFRTAPLPGESARDRHDDNGDVMRGTAEGIDWTYSPHVAPPNAPNEIEVRFADEVFQVLVNGVGSAPRSTPPSASARSRGTWGRPTRRLTSCSSR